MNGENDSLELTSEEVELIKCKREGKHKLTSEERETLISYDVLVNQKFREIGYLETQKFERFKELESLQLKKDAFLSKLAVKFGFKDGTAWKVDLKTGEVEIEESPKKIIKEKEN